MHRQITFANVSLDRSFPLSCRRHAAHADCRPHSHAFHELVIILNGSGRHVTEYGDYEIMAGDVFLVRGAMIHGYSGSEHLTLVNILFDPRSLQLPLDYLDDLPGFQALFRVEPRLRRQARFRHRLQLQADSLGEAAAMVARMEHVLQRKPPGYRLEACACLMQLLVFLSRCYFRTPSSSLGGESLQKFSEALSYIERNYGEPITIARLAKVAGMSPSTLTRTFHRIMGRSPLDHVIRVRIGRARELLQRADLRITEVAFACGFSDSNYFSRQFRKVTGITPRAFRQHAALQ